MNDPAAAPAATTHVGPLGSTIHLLRADADTVAAVTGQLAGSLYGLSGIPEKWLGRIAWRERLLDTAQGLLDTRPK